MTRFSRTSLARLDALAAAYRAAFDAVQAELARAPEWTGPPWVLALQKLPEDDLDHLPAALREAEVHRRRLRVALGAFAELAALEDDGVHGAAGLPDSPDHVDKRRTDRFLTVTSRAWSEGCSYVNGTFEPSLRPGPDPADTFDFPPRVDDE